MRKLYLPNNVIKPNLIFETFIQINCQISSFWVNTPKIIKGTHKQIYEFEDEYKVNYLRLRDEITKAEELKNKSRYWK